LRASTGAIGAAAPIANIAAAVKAAANERRPATATMKTSGTAATSSSATAGRVASASPPATPASRARPRLGARMKYAPAGSIEVKKKRKSVSVSSCVLKTMRVTDSAARMPAINPTRGETSVPSAAMSVQVPASITACARAISRGASPNVPRIAPISSG